MINSFKMEINNFCSLNKAIIDLKKLNIIAGINGSGKSISSKLLYCFLVANSKNGNYLANKSLSDRFNNIIEDIKLDSNIDFEVNLFDGFPNFDDATFTVQFGKNLKNLKKIIEGNNKYIDKLNEIDNVMDINNNLNHRFFNISNFLLNSEFDLDDFDINDAYLTFYGEMDSGNFSYKLKSDGNKMGFIIDEGKLNYLNFENTIYIDSYSIFDINGVNQLYFDNLPIHLKFLSNFLSSKKNNTDVYDAEFNHKLDTFNEKIFSLIGGYIYYDLKLNEYFFQKGNKRYSMKNTASGVKQLGIIQYLLDNRFLNRNSFLIIDEPEANLHPEWQVYFAEILVLMVKELDIYSYINSHSPHFIEAIEVFSTKYGLKEETNFYLTQKVENEDKYNVKKVPYNRLYELYDNLGDPYDLVDAVRGHNIANNL